jgi:hypothetical protein
MAASEWQAGPMVQMILARRAAEVRVADRGEEDVSGAATADAGGLGGMNGIYP